MLSVQQLTRPDGSPVRVLVVDDEVNIAELLAMALRYEGWDLRMEHSGGDAVAAARDFRPDAVVLDIMLPDFDDLEVLRPRRATCWWSATSPSTRTATRCAARATRSR